MSPPCSSLFGIWIAHFKTIEIKTDPGLRQSGWLAYADIGSRRMVKKILFVLFVSLLLQGVPAEGNTITMTVYKNRFCGCCSNWARYMRGKGFQVTEKSVENGTFIKKRFGIPERLWSCHTALVGGYVIEGHVPADDVKRLLKERPDIRGLAVGGMPAGSPGMEQGSRKDHFKVIAVRKDGSTFVYNAYRGN